jgi:Prokaryotic E2 family E/Multiubiquitin
MSSENQEPSQDDVVDLEAYFAAQRPVPHGKKYRIRIDKQFYVVHVAELTGRQILELAGKTPEKFLLRQKTRGGVEPVRPDQVVSFVAPGIERFMTIPNEVQEGEPAPPRLQFNPLPADVEYLTSLGLRWEAIIDAGIRAIVIYQWPLPTGYNVGVVDVHVRLTAGYPDAEIDMAYFAPALTRADARGIANLSACTFDGREWQQWSRHRVATSKWRIGEDDISTHMPLVRDWLEVELRK